MKALQLTEAGAQPSVHEVELSEIPTGHVSVRIQAAALNHRDVWIQKGLYPSMSFPIVLGSDGSGTVDGLGAGVAPDWAGKSVIINPSLNWGDNPAAQGDAYKILGMPDRGTFAEYVIVPAEQLVEKPAHLSFSEAAALPLAGLTAYRALFTRAQLEAGEKVLITGIGGGVALFACQFAAAAGAQVWASSSSSQKIEQAKAFGLTDGYDYTDFDWTKKAISETGGFDVIIDGAAGTNYGDLIEVAAPGGRIVHYGGTAGDPDNLPIRKVFWKQLNILGSTMGTAEDFQRMTRFVAQHTITPVIDSTTPLASAQEAFAKMDNGDQFGKLVLEI